MYHQIMTTIIWIYIYDVIDGVTRSQKRSNFEILQLSLCIILQTGDKPRMKMWLEQRRQAML